MFETLQLHDIISSKILNELIFYYDSLGQYDTTTMNKAPPGPTSKIVLEILEEKLNRKLELVYGNFYKHTLPYLPHTDYKTHNPGSINIVIPLRYTDRPPHLVIFDQRWKQDSITWCMHHPVKYFEINIGVKGSPFEYPVENLTDRPVDDKLYETYLSHYPKETLFGLTGEAYEFKPGSVILFDNQKIHCTSSFSGEKLGLTLRVR